MKLFNVSGCLKMVSETKGDLEIVVKQPTYFETLTLVHGIAISLFVYFFKKVYYENNAGMKIYAGLYFCYQCSVSA